ncbi:MAG: hypothetical protein WKF97_19675 [Chitinophagaceae bacterium]
MANVFTLLLAVLSYIIYKKNIYQALREYLNEIKSASKLTWLFFVFFVVVMAAISYIPSSNADDIGCFSPLIKWIQEYGTVKGLANLDPRFGYNSSWFGLQSLFGFAFLNIGLFNDLNSLLFLYMLIYALKNINLLLQGQSDFLTYFKSLFFLPVLPMYFGFEHDMMLYSIQFFTNSTYDIPVTYGMWMVFFLFLELNTKKEKYIDSLNTYLIIIYSAWLVTVKLNAVPLIIITTFLLGTLMYNRKYKHVAIITGMGLAIIAPWMFKTVLSCGYLIFPFEEINLLDVDWKLSERAVVFIENSITTWAIDPEKYGSREFATDRVHFSVPLSEWFPIWYGRQNYINTIIFFSTIAITIAFISFAVIQVTRQRRHFFSTNGIYQVFILTIIAGAFLWFFKGPLFRYGYGYLLFYCMFGLTMFVYYFLKDFHAAYLGIFILAYIFYTGVYYADFVQTYCSEHLIKGAPGITVPAYKKEPFDKGTVIHIVESGCGNAPLPASPGFVYTILRPALRGKSIKEGFRHRSRL